MDERSSQFLFDYRTSIHTNIIYTNECLAKLLLGRMTHTRFDMLKPNIRKTVLTKQEKQGKSTQTVREFEIRNNVLVRDYGKQKK